MATVQPISYATRPSRPSQPYYCPALPWLAEKKSMATETVGELLVRNIKNIKDWETKVIAGYLVDVHHMQKLPLPRKEHVGQLDIHARFVPNQAWINADASRAIFAANAAPGPIVTADQLGQTLNANGMPQAAGGAVIACGAHVPSAAAVMDSPSRSARSTASPAVQVGGPPTAGIASRGSPRRVAVVRGVGGSRANTMARAYSTAQVMQDPDLRALSRFYTGEPDPADWQDENGGGLGPNGRYLYPPPPN